MAGDTFSGFPKPGIKFLKDLKKNNDREWFAANKKVYEQEVKVPAEVFLTCLRGQVEEMMGAPIKAKLFRIHRDVRFSKDKTPYNTHVRMGLFGVSGKTGLEARSGFYYSLDTAGVTYGAGTMSLDKLALGRYRAAVGDSKQAKKLIKVLAALETRGFRSSEPELKRIPSGFDVEGVQADLLRRKSLSVWRDNKGHAAATGSDAVAQTMSAFGLMKPLHDFLMKL